MTKERARKILEDWINKETDLWDIKLPINDMVIFKEQDEYGISQWSFKGLIKIAYEL